VPADSLIFINVSPASLDHGRFGSETLLKATSLAGIEPGRVVFEITERAVARAETVVREAKRLRSLGFKLALDDVGAGNAGLEVLRQVPVDFVKIDRSVVQDALKDGSAAAVLAGIVAFARKARTYAIAEGIASPEVLRMVRPMMAADAPDERSIQGAQGFLLGTPQHIEGPPAPIARPDRSGDRPEPQAATG
jgi:EAL domain-containing protein (putative c-di-GMP-specific phosphodiesterase class I)